MSIPNKIIDELVRDLTKVGSIPKSEARRMPSQQVILKALTSFFRKGNMTTPKTVEEIVERVNKIYSSEEFQALLHYPIPHFYLRGFDEANREKPIKSPPSQRQKDSNDKE